MTDRRILLKFRRFKIYGNKYFKYTRIVENGVSRPYSLTLFGKRFLVHSRDRKHDKELRKILRGGIR